jgi:hypothetical protein
MNKAERELEEFLLKNPHLANVQRKLEKEMDQAPDQYRILVVMRRLADNLDELKTELELLKFKMRPNDQL